MSWGLVTAHSTIASSGSSSLCLFLGSLVEGSLCKQLPVSEPRNNHLRARMVASLIWRLLKKLARYLLCLQLSLHKSIKNAKERKDALEAS